MEKVFNFVESITQTVMYVAFMFVLYTGTFIFLGAFFED